MVAAGILIVETIATYHTGWFFGRQVKLEEVQVLNRNEEAVMCIFLNGFANCRVQTS